MSREFEIKDQTKLPVRRCVELVLNGIQFRLFRASVTVAIIALAVAFMVAIVGDGVIGRKVIASLTVLTRPRQEMLFWVHRLSAPLSERDIMQSVRKAEPGSPRWQEFKTWGRCDDRELSALKEVAVGERPYLRFFAGLGEGKRRSLAGRARGRDIFRHLGDEEAFRKFRGKIANIGKQFPASVEEFKAFVDRFMETEGLRQRLKQGHAEALQALSQAFPEQTAQKLLATLDIAKVEKLEDLGFQVPHDDIETLRGNAQLVIRSQTIERLLYNTVLKQRFATRFGVERTSDITSAMFFNRLAGRGGARWLLDTLRKLNTDFPLTEAQVRETARERVRQRKLAAIESAVEPLTKSTGLLGFSPRVLWLILVSLIVCTVGIANAMLMSVTERFAEIATMKCLGATDRFIMLNFILESSLQGFAGGVFGGVIGFMLAIVRSSVRYGAMALNNLPWAEGFAVFGICLVVGVGLSVVAAIYPAWVAARLAPMEAMRVE